MTEDGLLGGRVRLLQPRQGFRAAIDPVLLAAFVPARSGEAVLEIGCGTGAAFLCLAARARGVTVTAIERDPELAALALRNAALNGAEATILAEDCCALPTLPPMHHAMANPPYWTAGTASPHAGRRQAAHEDVPLSAWIAALTRPLRHKGTVSLVLPAARLAEAAAGFRDAGCGAVRLLPLWPRAGAPAKRVLLQARKGGRGADEMLPGLVLHEADGSLTSEAENVLRDCEGLCLPRVPGREALPGASTT
ncbi:tRNA1(Val) (adenine(37)-N6)-methyltransferase [Roseococcus sp. SYP-B2431]|uniref:tRNA1(Val) (adenine(37)-N6)-methyltransferase n=1 Tax=Roseococcus sp. SYP-B2431 TaxID=2496640 RepID=UPI001F0DFF56|nr:methyltransferase domain-containing protein [Roseococcus sp. SYP-B2431]